MRKGRFRCGVVPFLVSAQQLEHVRKLERESKVALTIRTNSAGKKRRVVRLSEEAFNLVEEKANEIANALLKATTDGKVMSARLLVELAEGNVLVEDVPTDPSRSLALRLANEPEWEDPDLDEADDEEPFID
jgi:hypothetical protein